MTADQEIANAIADGINCIAELVSALGDEDGEGCTRSSAASPQWPGTLQAMERAFEAVIAKEVTSSLVIGQRDVERVSRMRALVSEWLKQGHAPEEIKGLAESILDFFGLPIPAQGNSPQENMP